MGPDRPVVSRRSERDADVDHHVRVFLPRHPRNLDALHGFFASQPGEFAVRIPHVARYEIVEFAEVLEVVKQLHSHLLQTLLLLFALALIGGVRDGLDFGVLVETRDAVLPSDAAGLVTPRTACRRRTPLRH